MEKTKQIIRWKIIIPLLFLIGIPVILSILIFSVDLAFGILMIIAGLLGTVFNKQLYLLMVKLNLWGFGKMELRNIGESVKSRGYRRFYRTSTFLVGLLLLFIGVFDISLYFGIDLRSYFN